MSELSKGSALGIVSYLVLAFGLAWIPWILLLPDQVGGDLSKFELIALPGAFAPALATFVVRKWITREGFADAGLGLHFGKWPYYLFGWLLPYAIVAFICVTAIAFGIAEPNFTPPTLLAHLPPQIPRADAKFVLPLTSLITALVCTPLLFGEEFGWRGYLQLRLFPTRPTLAAIVTGLIWGVWHWPVLARGFDAVGSPVTSLVMLTIGAIFMSIIFGWIRRNTGSVWATSLAHSATNAIGGSLTVLWFANPSSQLYTDYFGFLGWIPLGLLCVWIIARTQRLLPAR